jgi:hypothetical protein
MFDDKAIGEAVYRTGRPLGGQRFIDKLERIVGRKLRPPKPGRPRTNEN